MLYLICALSAEARPFLDHVPLKRSHALPYPLHENDTITLLVTQPGYENALLAASALLGYRPPEADDLFVNVGRSAVTEATVHPQRFGIAKKS